MTRNRKPYVEHMGIKRQPIIVTINGVGQIELASTHPHKSKDMTVVSCKPIMVNGHRCEQVRIDTRPEIAMMIETDNAAYETAFVARYPGIYELVNAINDDSEHYEATQRAMEDEYNDGVRMPANPKLSVADAQAKYPIASAYLTIVRYSQADPSSQTGYDKRCAGKRAVEALESGADVIATRDKMVADYNALPIVDRS